MKSRLMLGTATAALSVALLSHPGAAATLDDVLNRLDKLEKENSELRHQVKELRETRRAAPAPVAAAAPATPADFKGNPVYHGAVATSPAPKPILTVAGQPLITKAPGAVPLVDNTSVTLYGHVDVSGDLFNPSVFDQGTKFGIASNLSYFGIRARHNLSPYGWDGWAVVAQFETLVEVSATPSERAALGSRDSYVGLESPWGAIKAGKSDSPYKRSTSAFDPFSATLGDYNSIMGNTGGDNRAEFDWRMPHAVWYESPIWNGFQFSAMFAPGQNYAPDNSDYAYGEFNCPGTSVRGSGSGFPGTGNGQGFSAPGAELCNDGSYGNAYSAALTFKNGAFTAIGAYELHENVNRLGDEGTFTPTVDASGNPLAAPMPFTTVTGVHNEWAAKIGAGYRLKDGLGDLQLYAIGERIHRDDAPDAWNERSRDAVFASATQFIGPWALSASYAHAFASPGNPALLSPNNANAYAPPFGTGDVYQANLYSDAASQYAVGAKYRFSQWASWYVVGSLLQNDPGAHYCLGASGHGYQVCSRDQYNDTIGGATIKAVTSGLTFDF